MINLLFAFWRDDHSIKLNKEFQLDDQTCLGGVNFFFCGMASVFCSPLNGFPFLIFMFHLMQLVHWALKQSSILNGSRGHSLLLKTHYHLPTRNFSL